MFKLRFPVLAATLAVSSAIAFNGVAHAQTALNPGGSVTPPPTVNAAPFGGTFIESSISNYTGTNAGNTITGSLISTVYSTTTGPFGTVATPTLDFYYQLIAGAGSTTGIDSMSLSSFAPNGVIGTIQVGQDTDGGVTGETATGTANILGSTRGGSGVGVVLSFTGVGATSGLTTGQTSSIFVVRTNGVQFSRTGGAAFLGVASVAANSQATVLTPGTIETAAPEPGSLALIATGMMGAMGMVVRRRRSAK